MVNKVVLIGHLGQDPEVRHLESGTVVAKFSIATNERYKDKSGELKTLTEWHDVVMWRGLAETAERILNKGKLVYVEGKLTHRKWQDKEGVTRRSTEVLANTFQVLDKKESSSNISEQKESIHSATASGNTSSGEVKTNESEPSLDDDLPF